VNIEVVETTVEQKALISNLYQFYMYDFSEMVGFGVEANGRFEDSDLEGCWQQPWIHTYLLKVEGEPAGLALVYEPHHSSYLNAWINHYEMAEFFVMRKFRKRGAGGQVATMLFDRFRGRWRVAQGDWRIHQRRVRGYHLAGQHPSGNGTVF
jgi:predicted acetyltransferase